MAHPEIARYTETNVTPAILVNSSSPTASSHPASLPSSLCIVSYREKICARTIRRESTLIAIQVKQVNFSIIENQFLRSFINGNERSTFSKELPREQALPEKERSSSVQSFVFIFYIIIHTYNYLLLQSRWVLKGFSHS